MTVLADTLTMLLEFLKTNRVPPTQCTADPDLDLWLSQVQDAEPKFMEWDEQRGMYYLDFGLPGQRGTTVDFTVFRLRTPQVSDIYRFESNKDGELTGVEFQTQAPGPLPFLSELAPLAGLSPSPICLTRKEWVSYLHSFLTGL